MKRYCTLIPKKDGRNRKRSLPVYPATLTCNFWVTMKRTGKIYGINKNLITVEFEDNVLQNEIGYARIGESDIRLKAEIIRIKGNRADLQVFEETRGLRQGDLVEFTGSLLSAELGPGLLGQFFDGMQNPLEKLADKYGEFLERGEYLPPLDEDRLWQFTPIVKKGQQYRPEIRLEPFPRASSSNKIMVPFYLKGRYELQLSPLPWPIISKIP
jgi:Archaeal/vacuolar-type H+-ATPase subunit A